MSSKTVFRTRYFAWLMIANMIYTIPALASTKHYISGMTVCGKNIPDEVKSQTCGFSGSTISMFAVGENFVGIDEESLRIKTFTVNGKDLRQNRSKHDNVELGSFPDVSEDGKYADWDLVVKEGFNNTFSKIRIAGSVDILKSEQLLEKSSRSFDPEDFKSFSVGPVQIKGTEVKQPSKPAKDSSASDEQKLLERAVTEMEKLGPEASEEEAKEVLRDMGVSEQEIGKLLGNVMMQMMESMFGNFEPSDDEFSITLESSASEVERIEMYANGQQLDSAGSMTVNGVRSMQFDKVDTDEVTLKVYYWKDLEKETINFSF